ncbi:unnamed protein product [Diatraea saccharalis]|uniref:Transposase domain-containing protein n=1 Tax=Diatraea saccharalis TaxID=40085 RepID=A0A9N9WIH9_9NEOP|nr:unnamed protein product [Diatraea saccharalis]
MKTIENGEYWHNGLTKCLRKTLENWVDVPNKVKLNFNFDGLPIFKSSNKEFWPILCNIYERPDIDPFVIGIYFGVGKPKNIDQYLDDFVKEIGNLIKEGIYIEKPNKIVSIEIRCFICDSPARAYIKGVCNFNAKHGCLKCVTVGEYSHLSHTVTFPETNCRPRTDQEFRDKKYGPHHKKDSPILRLPVNMIQDLPIADSLHLVDLGIMKRLLVGWRNGNFGKYITKWSARNSETVSNFLVKRKLPSEIHRSVRGLDCLSHWKASEYRSFLLYLSIVILPEVLQHDAFSHFLAFFCGITICSCKNYSHFLPLAKELLQYFVEHYKDFYGPDYITSNVHNVVQLTDEVQRFGPLHTFSAYPFENKLYLIKRMLRHGNKPLAQVAKKFSEDSASEMSKGRESRQIAYVEPFVTTNSRKINALNFSDFKISVKPQNKYVLCNNNDILEVTKIETAVNSEIKITYYKITDISDVFELPIKSSFLKIFKAKLPTTRRTETIVSPKDIKTKLVCTDHKNYLYFVPLLHTV